MLGGHKINPKGAKVPQGTVLEGRELVAFKTEKAHIDTLLGGGNDLQLAQNVPARVHATRVNVVAATAPALRGGESVGGPGGLRMAVR
jgi:hypothetical protein